MQWLKNFRSAKVSEQERVELEVFYHAVKIAGECTHCFTPLLHNGYNEYLWSVRYDKTRYEDSASLYFDIWKLVAKQKVGFLPKYTQMLLFPLVPALYSYLITDAFLSLTFLR